MTAGVQLWAEKGKCDDHMTHTSAASSPAAAKKEEQTDSSWSWLSNR